MSGGRELKKVSGREGGREEGREREEKRGGRGWKGLERGGRTKICDNLGPSYCQE